MDVLTFIAEMTKALGWPMALVSVVLLLRRQLSAAIDRLRALKHGETELSFGEKIGEAKVAAEGLGVTVYQPLSGFQQSTVSLSSAHPTAAILEGWRPIEVELKNLVEQRNHPWRGVVDALNRLRAEDAVPVATLEIARYLNDIRNRAVHGADAPTEGEALEFLMLSKSIAQRLRQGR